MRHALLLLSLVAALPQNAMGQRASPSFSTVAPARLLQAPAHRDSVKSWDDGPLVGGAIFGGTVGFFAGGYVGYHMEDCSYNSDFCGLGGLIIGAGLGESFGVALGTHVAAGSRGNLALEAAASTGVLLAGAVVAGMAARAGCKCGGYLFAFGTPIAQIAASIAIEKATSRQEP